MSDLQTLDIRKVTYNVVRSGTMISVHAILPLGFTMRTFNRIFDLRHAPELNMTDEEYILYQQERLRENLMERINVARHGTDRRLGNGR